MKWSWSLIQILIRTWAPLLTNNKAKRTIWLVYFIDIVYAAPVITKGLGFQSNYQLYLSSYQKAPTPNMTPRIIVPNDKSNPNRKLTWFDHLNAFDSVLYYQYNYLFKQASELLDFTSQVDTSVEFRRLLKEILKCLNQPNLFTIRRLWSDISTILRSVS